MADMATEKAVDYGITFIINRSKYVFRFNTYVQDLRQKLRDLEAKRKTVLDLVKEGERNNEKQVEEVTVWLERVEKAVKDGKEILENIEKRKPSKITSCLWGTTTTTGPNKESNDNENANEGEQSKRSSTSTGEGGAEDGLVMQKKKHKQHKLRLKPKLKLRLNRCRSNNSRGGFVLNPWTRYRTSQKAEGVMTTISELEKKTFERYTHPTDPRGVVSHESFEEEELEPRHFLPASRQAILRDIKEALDDDKISVVGIWGLSGVGKSSLLDVVADHVKQHKFGHGFDEIAKATVSRTPDIERIQAELADWLGLSKLKEISSMDQKAKELTQRLRDGNKKCLIILDDLARKIDLEKIGIPFTKGGKIKLLLTSRNEEVLQSGMASQLNFELKPFEEEEAFKLFKKTLDKDGEKTLDKVVGEDVETLKLINELLATECAGLPLSIVQLAIHLTSSPRSGWKDTLMKLKGSNELGVKNFIEEMLESSYAVMKSNEVKSLLLLCGQIGTQIISVDKLVTYGISLGIFEKIDTIKEARDRMDTLLKKLKSCRLLEDEKPGFIKIHDHVSDVALGIDSKAQHSIVVRSRDQLMNAFKKEDIQKCKSISLLNFSDVEELPQGWRCPELNMFCFNYTGDHTTKFKLPDAILQNMEKLKVLELSGIALVPLPQSIQLLHQLQTLCLDSCDIEDFMFLGKLKQLQVLIVRKSKMIQLPKEITELTDLKVLDLRTCNNLVIIEQGILGSLSKLEELLLPSSFMRWDERQVRQPINASLTELRNMPCLSALHINIPDFTALPIDIPLVKLMRYSLCSVRGQMPHEIIIENVRNTPCLSAPDKKIPDVTALPSDFPLVKLLRYTLRFLIGQMRYGIIIENVVDMDEARTLTLQLDPCNTRVILEDFVQIALQKARELHLSYWVGYEKSVAALFKRSCSELKHIDVNHCRTFEYIIDLDHQTQLPSLESMYLAYLVRVKKIYSGGLLEEPFRKLKSITIEHCDSLTHVFSFSLKSNILPVLEELKVVVCEIMQHIFIITAKEHTAIQGETMDSKSKQLELKYLKKLELKNLPKLLGFCSNQIGDNIEKVLLDGRQVSFPRLETLTLFELSGFEKIAHYQYPPNLQSLKSLLISSCESLLSAVGSKLLAMVKNLEVLAIDSCSSMEVVFAVDEESSFDEFIKLNELKLIKLKSLKKIWESYPKNISFMVNLRLLKVVNCDQLAHLFSPSMAESLKNLSCLSIDNCGMMKGIFMEEMSSQEHHSCGLPSLKELVVKNCPNMNSFISLEDGSEDVPVEKSFFSSKVLLPDLETLVLVKIGKFKSIWGSSISEQSFDKLTSVRFESCDLGAIIFPSIMMKRLQHLKEIDVVDCSAVKVIFESGNASFRVSKLSRMRLEGRTQLADIVMSNSIPNKTVLGFPSLNDIRIGKCDNLNSLFDTATAMTLCELENLEIFDCGNMKAIVSEIEGDKNVGWKMMAFNKLLSLQLCNLDNLSHFCSGYSKLYFPVLKTFKITQCAKFKTFVSKLADAVGQKDTDSGSGSNVDNPDGVFYPLFDDKVMLPNLQQLQIKGMELKEIWHDNFPSGSFCKLHHLEVVGCSQISIVIPFFMLHNMHNLEQLTVESCHSVQVIFQLDGSILSWKKLARRTVCKLKKIRLLALPSLYSLHESESFPEYFPFHKLESLHVEDCGRLMNLFTFLMAKTLKKLEELTIRNCEKLEVVVAGGIVDHNGGTYRIVFPQLSVLKLEGLQNLRSFCTGKHTTKWPSLEHININDCSAIEAFVEDSGKHVVPLFLAGKESRGTNKEGGSSDNDKSDAFCKLKILQVQSCSNLKTIFPSMTTGGFRNLEELTVWNCECLKEVFQVEDCNEESATADNICFENLWKISIGSCNSLVHVFPTSVARSSHQLSTLEIRECNKIEEIITRKGECNKHDKEKACHPLSFFPKLISLALERMPLLRSFYGGLHSTKWPLLAYLVLRGCPAAKILSLEQEKWKYNDKVHPRLEEKTDNNNSSQIPSLKKTVIDMDMPQIPDEIIGNPTNLYIKGIVDEAAVKTFPWRFLLERPHDLQVLQIAYSDFEEIFPWSDNRVDEHGNESDKMVPFPYKSRSGTGSLLIENIRELMLFNLPKLKHVWKEGSALAHILDIVEELSVWSCPLLTGILGPSSSPSSFNHLKQLTIDACDGLRHLLTTSAARCLVHLTRLEVGNCRRLEEIVTHDDFSGDQNVRAKDKDNADITFHQLSCLDLACLPSLRRFSSTSCNLNFPYLVDLNLYCLKPSIKKELFSKGIVSAPLLSEEKRREVGVQD